LEPVAPAVALADLIDVRGAVVLAEALLAQPVAAPPVAPEPLRAAFTDGWGDIRRRLDEARAHAFRPRYRLTTPERAAQRVAQAGLSPRPSAASLRALTRTLWTPYADFIETQTKRARFALRDLRLQLGPLIAGQSAAATQLELLDTALATAVHARVEGLIRRIAHSAELSFGAQLKAQLEVLPRPPSAEDLAPFFGPEGAVRAGFLDALRLSRAVIDHEHRQLAGLIEAAIVSRDLA
jgi:hypothetical protein